MFIYKKVARALDVCDVFVRRESPFRHCAKHIVDTRAKLSSSVAHTRIDMRDGMRALLTERAFAQKYNLD